MSESPVRPKRPERLRLGGLSNLRSLYLYGHQLTGPIPMELGGLAKLESLYLHDNQSVTTAHRYGDTFLTKTTWADADYPGRLSGRIRRRRAIKIRVESRPTPTPSPIWVIVMTLASYHNWIKDYQRRYYQGRDNSNSISPVDRPGNTSLANTPVIPAIAVAALILIAAVLVPAHPASAQSNPASCAAGGSVADPANNPGLVSDCDALLAARDTLAGTATLNWSDQAHPSVVWRYSSRLAAADYQVGILGEKINRKGTFRTGRPL